MILFWFRQDLRVHDNPGLHYAASLGQVLPIYILDNVNSGVLAPGSASKVWLHHALASLNQNLNQSLSYF